MDMYLSAQGRSSCSWGSGIDCWIEPVVLSTSRLGCVQVCKTKKVVEETEAEMEECCFVDGDDEYDSDGVGCVVVGGHPDGQVNLFSIVNAGRKRYYNLLLLPFLLMYLSLLLLLLRYCVNSPYRLRRWTTMRP